MGSVGKSYAVLRGRLTGDPQEAQSFLNSLSVGQRMMRNRSESRSKTKKRKNYKMGQR
jgi:hypothetical protein